MRIPDTFLSVQEETTLFFLSAVMGGALELVWDGVRAFRIAVPHKKTAEAIEDALFLVVWAGCVVCFTSVLAKGDMRFFYIVGSILGFILTRLTIGNPVTRLLSRIIKSIYAFLRWLTSPVSKLVVSVRKKWQKKFVTNAKIAPEKKNIWSALLIAKDKMLYNRSNHKKTKGDGKRGRKKHDEEPQSQ